MNLPEALLSRRTPKSYRTGTHRAVDPNKTLARIQPLLPVFGITRLANITGLDSIGIPVYMSCRPNSRSLAVFQGKGLDNASAKVSAAMEAIETYHAETMDHPLKFLSYEDLRYGHLAVDVERLPFSQQSTYDPLAPILWIEGMDYLCGQSKWLPFELVHSNYTLPALTGSGAFVANTNGLASGNCMAEALCHALYEVIERDAVTLWKFSEPDLQDEGVIDLDGVSDPACQALLEKFEQAQIDVVVWDVTSDVGLPCFLCLAAGASLANGVPEFGAGCHSNASVALCRALSEAAQARTTYIAGARDDITAPHYSQAAKKERFDQARETIQAAAPRRDFAMVPDSFQETFEEELQAILAALTHVGVTEVLAVDLTRPGLNIPVVRAVVPGLETAFESPESDYVPGERAMEILQRRDDDAICEDRS